MDKIEEIRQKPEHIRMRYVWASVAVSMIFVLAIWLFSFSLGGKPVSNPINDLNKADLFDQLNGQNMTPPATTDGLQGTSGLAPAPTTTNPADQAAPNPEVQGVQANTNNQTAPENKSAPEQKQRFAPDAQPKPGDAPATTGQGNLPPQLPDLSNQ